MSPPRPVLVVVTRRLSDVLLATPLIRSLKSACPGTLLTRWSSAGRRAFLPPTPMFIATCVIEASAMMMTG